MTGLRPMWRSLTRLASLKDPDQLPAANAASTVDLEIRFDDGKTDVSQASLPALDALGKALAEVETETPLIIGVFAQETDGPNRGELAFRRAEAVKQYLVAKYWLDPVDLLTISISDKPKDFCCVRVFNLATKPKSE